MGLTERLKAPFSGKIAGTFTAIAMSFGPIALFFGPIAMSFGHCQTGF
jgi:hypothetical protein